MPASYTQLQEQFSENWFLGFSNWVTRFDHYLDMCGYDDCSALLDLLLTFSLSPEETQIAEQREGHLAWKRGGLDGSARERYWAYVEYFEALQRISEQTRSLVSLAFILRKQGSIDDAADCIMRATKVDPDPPSLAPVLDELRSTTNVWEAEAQQHFHLSTKSEEYLADRFAHGSWSERAQVVFALVELRMIDPLIRGLESSDIDQRVFSIRGIERLVPILHEDWIVTALEKALEDEHWFVRWRGAAALALHQGEAGLSSLLKAASDSDADVRSQAARALGVRKDKQARSALVKLLQDPDSYVRSVTVEALGRHGDTAVMDILLKAMDDPDIVVQRKVVRALSSLKDYRAQNRLLELVKKDIDLSLRLEAIHALGELGNASTAETLDSLELNLRGTDRVHSQLRKTMRQAVARIKQRSGNISSPENIEDQIRFLDTPVETDTTNLDQDDLEANIRLL